MNREERTLEVVRQWQDGAITYLEMVNALYGKVTVEDYKERDELLGERRTQFDGQTWPDQSCTNCEYICTIASTLDVWTCESPTTVSLIVRFGREPHEYASRPFTLEEWHRLMASRERRYARIDDSARRHCIVEIMMEHLPCTILNLTKFPGKGGEVTTIVQQ